MSDCLGPGADCGLAQDRGLEAPSKGQPVGWTQTGHALRVSRARARRAAKGHGTPEAIFSRRPAKAEDRVAPGHGGLVIGTGTCATRPVQHAAAPVSDGRLRR